MLAAAAGAVEALAAWLDATLLRGQWRTTTFERVQAGAMALTLLAGMLALVRVALAGVRAPSTRRSTADVERLVSEARTDPLTKLANRRAFDDDLSGELERRNSTGSVFSLLAIDLDGLKQINDTQGHQAGDARLRWIADRLTSAVGTRGRVYRTGGDEFMVLLPRTRALNAVELAHEIRRATATAATPRALSLGVTETRGTEHRHELVRQADLALYEAKRETLVVTAYRPDLEVGAAGTDATPKQSPAVRTLLRALEARDRPTAVHSETVAELAIAVARRQGIRGRRLEQLRVAALLHDVGKIGVGDALLHKTDPLTSADRDALQRHVVVGRDLVAAAGFPEEATWILHHHEHVDGSGYPDGLRNGGIPLESRIIAVADTFEAMTADRPYGTRHTPAQAVAAIRVLAGTRFDRASADALVAVVRPGSADHQPGAHEQHDKFNGEEDDRVVQELGHRSS